ncbi:hypothetical protein FNO01nite_24880 [Flavobacterium noncentrifugens]|uniref:Por secretion system C-terminal sorting domain-containing protein n=1 Tax=Flavobacterium noncentrifugens TaxID=1128970 RepID=A0A1G8ZVM2_9FLAO|nr:T9SS type A sorting domain-containing protein [Flavobacterium noncentrifugens]GEP51816.1 hypothetical protein FNO01nite_24880 [Flavobacterium noncentrifugens]SDK19041.1 Por secretion system C-terminal sorting domain-containing protein [Flavobacterium noncentrifugens]
MKKTILSFVILSAIYSNAQIIESNDFTAYTNGAVGTSVTGSVAGQGGFYTVGGTNLDYRILNDGVAHGRVFQLTGPANATDNHFMWKNGLPTAWSAREAGNDILEIEFDYYTGPITLSQNSIRLNVYNADLSKILAGFIIAQDSKIISGLAYYSDDQGTGTYQYSLGPESNPDLVLPINTWVRLGMSFKKSDGKVIWKGPGFDSYTNGTTAGLDPAEIDFIATAIYEEGAENTVASTARFDNYVVRAVATDMLLLSVDQIENDVENVAVYPNPVSDIINVSVKNHNIAQVSVSDMNGRIVKTNKFENRSDVKMDVSDLSAGIYIIDIVSENTHTIKKIVKK